MRHLFIGPDIVAPFFFVLLLKQLAPFSCVVSSELKQTFNLKQGNSHGDKRLMYFVPFKNKVNVQLGVQYSSVVKDDIRQPSI